MIKYRPLHNGVIGLLLATLAPFLFAASNPIIVESLETNPDAAVASGQRLVTEPFQPVIEDEFEPATSGGETQYQMQLLQQEVQELRGQVEQLSHALSEMQKTQNDRYLELDGRFQSLMQQGDTGSYSEPASTGQQTNSTVAITAGQDEKALYDTAVELIRTRQYDLAITQLQAIITQFPDGKYTANAYYWLGEVYAAKPEPDYEQARQALAQVITFFPENRKVPDAAFKLGKVYHLMGDCERATELLNQVIEQQQGRSVAILARDYLRDRVGTCQ